jgi:hypothetical protein
MAPRSSTSSSDGGIDLLTLVITAAASATAAYTCSKIWAPGTLASAAFTPVLVALIKEAIARPAKAVTQAVPVRGVVRSASGPTGTQVHESAPAPQADPAPPELERVAQQGEISYHSTGARRRWRLAIITGLLGFVVAALLFTVPELVAGRSASGSGSTTLFGGGHSSAQQPTQTTTVPGRTVTAPAPVTVTQPPAVTVTAPPAATTTVPAPQTTTTTPAPAPAGPGSSGPAPSNPVPVQP